MLSPYLRLWPEYLYRRARSFHTGSVWRLVHVKLPYTIMFFLKWAIFGLFFFIFVFSIQLTVNNVQYNFRQWLILNLGPLESEATNLTTEPQPLPAYGIVWTVGVSLLCKRLFYQPLCHNQPMSFLVWFGHHITQVRFLSYNLNCGNVKWAIKTCQKKGAAAIKYLNLFYI